MSVLRLGQQLGALLKDALRQVLINVVEEVPWTRDWGGHRRRESRPRGAA